MNGNRTTLEMSRARAQRAIRTLDRQLLQNDERYAELQAEDKSLRARADECVIEMEDLKRESEELQTSRASLLAEIEKASMALADLEVERYRNA